MDDKLSKLIVSALQEDSYNNDVTTLSIIDKNKIVSGNFVAKTTGIVSGTNIVKAIYQYINPKISVTIHRSNGSYVNRGTVIITLKGPMRDILKGERTALNFIKHMSGIATMTNRYVTEIKDLDCRILDTRKTTPLLRSLDQQAIRDGGGYNYHANLSDHILIRDSHIIAASGIKPAIEQVKEKRKNDLPIEVEVKNRDEYLVALNSDCDAIILDDMTNEEIESLLPLNTTNKKIAVSGDISFKRIRSVAKLGVNYIIVDNLVEEYNQMKIELKFYKNI